MHCNSHAALQCLSSFLLCRAVLCYAMLWLLCLLSNPPCTPSSNPTHHTTPSTPSLCTHLVPPPGCTPSFSPLAPSRVFLLLLTGLELLLSVLRLERAIRHALARLAFACCTPASVVFQLLQTTTASIDRHDVELLSAAC